MTKKEVDTILGFGQSHLIPIEGFPLGVTRFQAFLAICRVLKGKLYWYALRYAYDCSDDLYEYRFDVKHAFESQEDQKDFLMTKQERIFLQNLPEQITIYRGMTVDELKEGTFGCSWTLKKEVAEFFAYTYHRNLSTSHLEKTVHEIIIDKSEVIAFFNGREEFEIIYFPKPEGNKMPNVMLHLALLNNLKQG